jgi:putative redox protein
VSVKISAHILAGKKVELVHIPSQAKIITAAPVDNNGDGSSFSPTDLVAGALVSCSLTIMAIVAERNGYDLSNTCASIEKIMQASPRRIAELPIVFNLPKTLTAEARQKLENAAHTCPVHHSLLTEITITMSFIYDR